MHQARRAARYFRRPDALAPPNNSMESPPLRSGLYRPPRAGISDRPGQPRVEFGAILALAGRAAHLEAARQRKEWRYHQPAPIAEFHGPS